MGRHAAELKQPEAPEALQPERANRREGVSSGFPEVSIPEAVKLDEKILTVGQAAFAADMRRFDRGAYFLSLSGAAVALGSILGLIFALLTTPRGGLFIGVVAAALVAVGGYFHARKQEKLREPVERARFEALRDAINRSHGLHLTTDDARVLIRGGSVISTSRRNTAILHLLGNENGERRLFEAVLSAVPELQVNRNGGEAHE